MDRLDLYRNLARCGLALSLTLASAGCKTPKSEVPPSPTFSGNGQAPIGFNQEPNPMSGAATAGMPAGGQFGTPPGPSAAPNYGVNGGGFGGPGANLGAQSTMPPASTMPGAAGLASPGGVSNPATGIPQSGTGSSGPASGLGAAPTQNPF